MFDFPVNIHEFKSSFEALEKYYIYTAGTMNPTLETPISKTNSLGFGEQQHKWFLSDPPGTKIMETGSRFSVICSETPQRITTPDSVPASQGEPPEPP